MSSQMSPKVQNQIQQLQQVQQQLQTVLSQKAQYKIEIRETRRADEELADLSADATVFQSVGTVMMQKPKEAVSASLKEKVESLELRVKQARAAGADAPGPVRGPPEPGQAGARGRGPGRPLALGDLILFSIPSRSAAAC